MRFTRTLKLNIKTLFDNIGWRLWEGTDTLHKWLQTSNRDLLLVFCLECVLFKVIFCFFQEKPDEGFTDEMLRLNSIRVQLPCALKRQQCGILHNSVSKHMVKTWQIEQCITVSSFYCNIHLGQRSSASCVVLITQSETFAQRDHENVLKRGSQSCDLLPRPIIQHKPGLCTCNSLWLCSSDVRNCLFSDVFYSYTSAQVTVLDKNYVLQAWLGLFLFTLSIITDDYLWCLIMHAYEQKFSNC